MGVTMLAVATTTITVLAPTAPQLNGEAYSTVPPAGYTVIATAVRAVIGVPRGTEAVRGGQETANRYTLYCDPVPMDHYSCVVDEPTGVTYSVTWCMMRDVPEVAFVQAELKRVEGLV
jgi:hypothetical protein